MRSHTVIRSFRPSTREEDQGVRLRGEPHPPGAGFIRVAGAGRRSTVVRAAAASPLRLLMPRNHGRAAWIYTSSYGGGLVGGDHMTLDIEVDPGATAFVSTQASTKVYRSSLGASSELTARVGDHGLLVVAPDPVVCFRGSRYRQSQQFDLEGDAGLVVVDWLTSGRRAAGERWGFDDYSARLSASVDGVLTIHDSLLLAGDGDDLAARLGRFDVLAVAVVLGTALRAYAAALISRVAQRPLQRRSDRLVTAAALAPRRLGEIGCVVRMAGRSVEEVGRTIRECLGFVPDLLEDDPWLRKY
jgi:urease accessory protein